MRVEDLDLRELLQFDAKGGVLHFAGQRALVIDAIAMGILRAELIRTLGVSGARAILTRFGYAHGWRTAETLKSAFPWDSEDEWKRAGGQLHRLQGMVVVEPSTRVTEGEPKPLGQSTWLDSYEAEQHLLHAGQADEPVCWTLTGFASGYLSFCYGEEVFGVEDLCRGKGDAVCHLVARRKADWGATLPSLLPYFQKNCLEATLAHVTDELKTTEKRLRAKRGEIARASGPSLDISGIPAGSAAMRKTLDLARRVAGVDSTVLVTGESGAGKERIARLIHDESPRTGGPFVALNCGAVPESLLESELFGHARGAFTGASQDRPGLFEAANGGTLFLDEIGEVPPAMQVKLLRALQEREVRRVGENKQRRVDVRVVAATNKDLMAEVHAARFRQDLYYRLRVVEIRVPALRERREDILPLARLFIAESARRMKRKVKGLTTEGARRLVEYAWPGNVRELQNAIERAVALAREDRIDWEDLPEEIGAPSRRTPVGVSSSRRLVDAERDQVFAALHEHGGNRARAAKALGIGAATLYRRLKEYGEPPTLA